MKEVFDMKVENCLYCNSGNLSFVASRVDNRAILRCGECKLMMVESLAEDTTSLYSSAYFEKNRDTKSGYTNYLSSPVADLVGKYAFTRLFCKTPSKHLDLGCADGSLIEIFAGEGFSSKGLEISPEAVQIAKDKGLDVFISNLQKFPESLPKSRVITAFDLIEHVSTPKLVLKEIYDNLANEGYFIFSTLSVTKNDSSEYWFNNSLEHYVYYDKSNLKHILTDIFGKNFAFVEVEINGIYEFYGVAKKGDMSWEREIIKELVNGSFGKSDSEAGYFMSLFYNQISKFECSEKIIKHFVSAWPPHLSVQANFFNMYFQGKFEKAVEGMDSSKKTIPLSQTVFWQALSHAKGRLLAIKEEVIIKEYSEEIVDLRQQVFKLRDELHTMKNSRVLGRVIKLREFIGRMRSNLKLAPMGAIHSIRVIVAPFVPARIRRYIKKKYRKFKYAELDKPARIIKVENKTLPINTPLVSVVVPYYNREDTVDDTIESLVSQTFKNFETILVDDGSTDELSIKKLDEINKKHPWIKIVHQKNQGVAVARNNGISQSKGKYIICLDSDDILEPTYIEKSTIVLETTPSVALTTSYMEVFGVMSEPYKHVPYNPLHLYKNNMVITAAQFKKEAWEIAGGYKSGIGYEDWEFWLNLAEKGFWGKLIPETIFRYRTSMQSRYVGDKDVHWGNLGKIRALHPKYKHRVKKLLTKRQYEKNIIKPETAFINLDTKDSYLKANNDKPNILIIVPWMTFGGAETLIINFCEEIKDNFNLSFITGLESEHEWEHKFKQITDRVYHLRNLFENPALDIEFVSNYIKTRDVDIIHIIHTSFAFELLPEIKKRHPNIKVSVTVFNDRADHFNNSVKFQEYIDSFSTDNNAVSDHYRKKLESDRKIITIPNGINSNDIYNPVLFDRTKERKTLNLADTDLAVFFIGRLAEEKNVDIFLEVGRRVVHTNKNIKFFVIGDGNLRPAVEKQVKSIGSHNVQYLGYQSEIAKYLSAADIFVLPSSIEGFPLSILEAMAMKVAVVASDVGAVSDIIESGEDGLIVTPGSGDEIEAAIQKLSADAKLLEKIKSNARKKIDKKYSNTVLGANYKKLFNGIIK